VLLAERPEGKHLAGLWGIPRRQGGSPGRTPEAALIRELAEEIGIDVEASCLAPLPSASYAYPDFHLLMPLYVCRKWSGIVTAREGQRLKWVRPAASLRLSDAAADKPLVAMLRGSAVGKVSRCPPRRSSPPTASPGSPMRPAGAVVVNASHGGVYAAYLAAKLGAAAAIFNDAGVGREGAGIAVSTTCNSSAFPPRR